MSMWTSVLIMVVSLTSGQRSELPVQWKQFAGSGSIDSVSALKISKGLSRIRPSGIRRVSASDQSPFHADYDGPVWLLSYEDLPIVRATTGRERERAQVDVSVLLHANSGELLAVVTSPGSQWMKQDLPGRDPEEEAARDHWTVTSLRGSLPVSTIGQVISRAWEHSLNPAEWGQMILRPRFVNHMLPGRLKDGRIEPVYSPGVRWIVEIRGACRNSMGAPPPPPGVESIKIELSYFTGMLGLIDDATLEFIRGISLP